MARDKRRKPIVALEWDARTLRVAHATWPKKRVRIDKVLSVEIPADIDRQDAEQMGRYIRRVLDEQDIRTRRAVVDVPRDQAILSTMNLPISVPQELPSIVQFQIAKELPFAVADAAVDFAVPPNTKGRELVPISVAAVRNEFVAHYQAICRAAGLKVERMGLRPFANKIAVCEMLKEAMPKRLLFVDVGPTLMEVDVISAPSEASSSSLAFSRAASVMVPKNLSGPRSLRLVGPSRGDGAGEADDSGGDASDVRPAGPPTVSADAVVRELLLEVTRSVEAYRTSASGAVITHAVVAGDLGVEEALQEAIEDRFKISVDLYNPASSFGWTPEEGEGAAGFPAVLGLVLGEGVDERLHFDFQHPKQTVTQAQVQLRKAPRMVGWAAFIAIAAGIFYWANFSEGRKAIGKLQDDIANLETERGDKEEFIKLVEKIQAFDNDQEIWVDNLYDLIEALPDNRTLVLERIDMSERDRTFLLRTRAKASEDGDRIRADLDNFTRAGATKHRFDATLKGLAPPKQGDKYPYHFDIPVKLLDDKWDPSPAVEAKDNAEDVAPRGEPGATKGERDGATAGRSDAATKGEGDAATVGSSTRGTAAPLLKSPGSPRVKDDAAGKGQSDAAAKERGALSEEPARITKESGASHPAGAATNTGPNS